MKQHYVPQFFLKNFSYKERGEFYTNVFNKENSKKFNSNIDSVGCENNYYCIGGGEKFEGMLSKFESDFSRAIVEVIKTKKIKKLSSKTRNTLAFFIAMQLNRTPRLRITYQGALEKIYAQLLESHGIKPDIVPKISAEKAKEFQTDSFVKIADTIYPLILKLKWCLMINKYGEMPFWTSDNPVFFVNQLPSSPGLSNCGLACEGIEVHFPISEYLSLILLDPLVFPQYDEIIVSGLEDNIIYENSLQFFSATRFIYSSSNDFSLAEKMMKS